MENVWEKLKTLKGRSWTEAKDVLNRIKGYSCKIMIPLLCIHFTKFCNQFFSYVLDTGNRIEEIVVSYKINSETLAEEGTSSS